MIINLRTLDCLTNSPCQIHWKYIENSMKEMGTAHMFIYIVR